MEPDAGDNEPAGKAPVTIFVLDLLNSKFEDFAYIRYEVRRFLVAQPPQLTSPAELMVMGNNSLDETATDPGLQTQSRYVNSSASSKIVQIGGPDVLGRKSDSGNNAPARIAGNHRSSLSADWAWRDARLSAEPVRLVDAGGLRLQINRTNTGPPTVVLDSGLGDLLPEWQGVQAGVAGFARVCSYDRAGYGNSDAGPMPRTSTQIGTELHTPLQGSGEQSPYVLVGHSFGGYNVRVFTGKYPSEVAGIVLVDSPQEDQYKMLPAAWGKFSGGYVATVQETSRHGSIFCWPRYCAANVAVRGRNWKIRLFDSAIQVFEGAS